MEKIASFTVDHNKLQKGMYISRIDGDIVTYDIRMKKPNNNDFLSTGQMHTFEHLFATYARNSEIKDNVIYVGPMGCRTGFYFLVRNNVPHQQALDVVRQTLEFVRTFEGTIPGSTKVECGNYLDHDLNGAKIVAVDMIKVLKDWTAEKMDYEYHI
ncbi:S-ribosylhomocysteine lyase [Candidatus Ruminimicrobiellum ovillum]|uniref:S-ribosylhomocysteine lyase n=1 Tax=Candidatus Ruminimicrobiellum ovillum TaxID=1947927 RepID=UPI00355A25A3